MREADGEHDLDLSDDARAVLSSSLRPANDVPHPTTVAGHGLQLVVAFDDGLQAESAQRSLKVWVGRVHFQGRPQWGKGGGESGVDESHSLMHQVGLGGLGPRS